MLLLNASICIEYFYRSRTSLCFDIHVLLFSRSSVAPAIIPIVVECLSLVRFRVLLHHSLLWALPERLFEINFTYSWKLLPEVEVQSPFVDSLPYDDPGAAGLTIPAFQLSVHPISNVVWSITRRTNPGRLADSTLVEQQISSNFCLTAWSQSLQIETNTGQCVPIHAIVVKLV